MQKILLIIIIVLCIVIFYGQDEVEDFFKTVQDEMESIIHGRDAVRDNRAADMFQRGKEKLQHGDYTGAEEEFSRVIERDPNAFGAYLNRGVAKFNAGDYKGALADFSITIAINPDVAEAYYNRGVVKAGLDDMKGACSDWRIARELEYPANDLISQYCR